MKASPGEVNRMAKKIGQRIKEVWKAALFKLSPEETKEEIPQYLTEIEKWFAKLEEVDTSGVEPASEEPMVLKEEE